MTVTFNQVFLKDLKRIKDNDTLLSLKKCIEELKQVSQLTELSNIKKIKTSNFAFRIKVKSYRIGFYLRDGSIELVRVLHRKDIYKFFPK
jgi:mRNA interferase RelE/StbE